MLTPDDVRTLCLVLRTSGDFLSLGPHLGAFIGDYLIFFLGFLSKSKYVWLGHRTLNQVHLWTSCAKIRWAFLAPRNRYRMKVMRCHEYVRGPKSFASKKPWHPMGTYYFLRTYRTITVFMLDLQRVHLNPAMACQKLKVLWKRPSLFASKSYSSIVGSEAFCQNHHFF